MAFISPDTKAVSDALSTIVTEISYALHSVRIENCKRAARMIASAPRLYFAGAGRSGIGMGMNAMRFMHLGLKVHMLSESTAPAVSYGDVVIIPSGSGSTDSVLAIARKVVRAGADVIALTTATDSPLSQIATVSIIIDAAGKQSSHRGSTVQYAGSLFEQAAILVLDSLFHAIWQANHLEKDVLWARHANWE
ncbi:hypothetical protein HK22_08065 [Gluconobacter sp. DsW_056]|uniref:6-phospho-3-hexuloisomerase n=1 Tax=Gluconobacter sp. DsW_056 TaxID=1511209 RepID=UPI000A3BD404|nr:6-phospho-3-hexuloisomerase [Gluconobacter sp. DsW_056]OUI80105.1 hypothetical protein HK22_08065 [Gluconobacter sp. DsW_056]